MIEKFTNRELLALRAALTSINSYKEVRFLYALSKNVDRINKALETVEKFQKTNEEIIAGFTKDRLALVAKLANKDAKGAPIFITREDGTQHYDLSPSNLTALEEKLEKLKKTTHAKAFEQYKAAVVEFDKVLDEPNEDYVVFKVKQEVLPALMEPSDFNIVYLILEQE